MKIKALCMQCDLPNTFDAGELIAVPINSDGFYMYTCKRGHTTSAVLQQQRFELLFEIGVHAIIDGYYREAVVSFHSSLERFYEWAARVMLYAASEDHELFETAFPPRSEPQLGFAAAQWACTFRERLPQLSGTQIQFRNDVVHNGEVPTRQKAVQHGEAILAIAHQGMNRIQAQFPDAVLQVTFQHQRRASANLPSPEESPGHRVSMSHPMLLSHSAGPDPSATDIEAYIARLECGPWRVQN